MTLEAKSAKSLSLYSAVAASKPSEEYEELLKLNNALTNKPSGPNPLPSEEVKKEDERLSCLITDLRQKSSEYGIHLVDLDDECPDTGADDSWEDVTMSDGDRCESPTQPSEIQGSVTIDGFDFRTTELDSSGENVFFDEVCSFQESEVDANSSQKEIVAAGSSPHVMENKAAEEKIVEAEAAAMQRVMEEKNITRKKAMEEKNIAKKKAIEEKSAKNIAIELEAKKKAAEKKKAADLILLQEHAAITPTKTTDIRKIKGWKNKVFSVGNDIAELVKEKQSATFHYDDTYLLNSNEIKIEEESITDDYNNDYITDFLQDEVDDEVDTTPTVAAEETVSAEIVPEHFENVVSIPMQPPPVASRVQASVLKHTVQIRTPYFKRVDNVTYASDVNLSNSIPVNKTQTLPKSLPIFLRPQQSNRTMLTQKPKYVPINQIKVHKHMLNPAQEESWRRHKNLSLLNLKNPIRRKQVKTQLLPKPVTTLAPKKPINMNPLIDHHYKYIREGTSIIRLNGSKGSPSVKHGKTFINIPQVSVLKPLEARTRSNPIMSIPKSVEKVIPEPPAPLPPVLPPPTPSVIHLSPDRLPPVFGIRVSTKIGSPLPAVITDQIQRLRNDRVDIDQDWIKFATSVVSTDGTPRGANDIVLTVKLVSEPGQPLAYAPAKFREVLIEKPLGLELEGDTKMIVDETLLTDVRALVDEMVAAAVKQVEVPQQPAYDPTDSGIDCSGSDQLPAVARASGTPLQRKTKVEWELKRLNVTMIKESPAFNETTDAEIGCTLDSCKFGCVCSSLRRENCLGYAHCGKAECTLECTCTLQTRDKANQISLSEDVVSQINLSLKHLARKEKEFQQTVVLANNDMIVVEGCQVPIAGRRRRDIKIPQRYREEEEEVHSRRRGSQTQSGRKLSERNPFKIPANAYIPKHVAELNEKSKPIDLSEDVLVDLEKRNSNWCSVQMTSLDGVDDVVYYCLYHSKHNCPCFTTCYKYSTNSVLNFLTQSFKSPRRNVAVKRTASIRNVHNYENNSARTHGTHMDYSERNRLRVSAKKRARMSTGSTPDYLSLFNPTSLAAELINMESLPPAEQETDVNLTIPETGKFTEDLLVISGEANQSKLIRLSALRDGFNSQSLHMWISKEGKVLMSLDNIKPDFECVDARSTRGFENTMFDSPMSHSQNYAIVYVVGKYWCLGSFSMYRSNDVNANNPRIKFRSTHAVMKVPLPRTQLASPCRWFLIVLNNGFDTVRVKGWKIHRNQMTILNQTAATQNKILVARLQVNSYVECESNNLQTFGLYALPVLNGSVILGPFALSEKRHMQMYSAARDGKEEVLGDEKIKHQGSRWLYEEGKEQGEGGFENLLTETPVEIADRMIAEKLSLKLISEKQVLPPSGVQDIDFSSIFSSISSDSSAKTSVQTSQQRASVDATLQHQRVLQPTKSLTRYSATATPISSKGKDASNIKFESNNPVRVKFIPSIPSLGYLQGYALPNGNFKLQRTHDTFDLNGLNQFIYKSFSTRIKFIPQSLNLTWTPVNFSSTGHRCARFNVNILDGNHILMEDGIFTKEPNERPTAHEMYQMDSPVLTAAVNGSVEKELQLEDARKQQEIRNKELVRKLQALLERQTDVAVRKHFHDNLVEILLNPNPVLKPSPEQQGEDTEDASMVIDLDSDVEEISSASVPALQPDDNFNSSTVTRATVVEADASPPLPVNIPSDDEILILDTVKQPKVIETIDLEDEEISTEPLNPLKPSNVKMSGLKRVAQASNNPVETGPNITEQTDKSSTVSPQKLYSLLLKSPSGSVSGPFMVKQKSATLNPLPVVTSAPITLSLSRPAATSAPSVWSVGAMGVTGADGQPPVKLRRISSQLVKTVQPTVTYRPTLRLTVTNPPALRPTVTNPPALRPYPTNPPAVRRPMIGQLLQPTVGQPVKIIVKSNSSPASAQYIGQALTPVQQVFRQPTGQVRQVFRQQQPLNVRLSALPAQQSLNPIPRVMGRPGPLIRQAIGYQPVTAPSSAISIQPIRPVTSPNQAMSIQPLRPVIASSQAITIQPLHLVTSSTTSPVQLIRQPQYTPGTVPRPRMLFKTVSRKVQITPDTSL